MTKTLMELRAEAEASVAELNKAILSDSHKAIKDANAKASATISEYNMLVQNEEFSVILGYEDPMLEALTRLTLPCIKTTTRVEKDTGYEHAEIQEDKAVINLVALEEASEVPLFPNGQWRYWLASLTYRLAARAYQDSGGDAKDFSNTFKMSEGAKGVDLGATPTSNAQIVKQLQAIVDAIYFVDNGENVGLNQYKVLTKDVKYMLYIMCSRGRKTLSVSLPKTSTMLRLVTEVLHRIVTDADYTAEYDMIEKKA